MTDDLTALRAENAALREALRFYANEDEYSIQIVVSKKRRCHRILFDGGHTARKALETRHDE